MKKRNLRNQELEGKKRRLTLSRETIKALENPALLELVRGGLMFTCGSGTTSQGDYEDYGGC